MTDLSTFAQYNKLADLLVQQATKEQLAIEGHMDNENWNSLATNTIKAELTRAGVSYEELIRRLSKIGVQESYTGVAAKINRGTFSFLFFMQRMRGNQGSSTMTATIKITVAKMEY